MFCINSFNLLKYYKDMVNEPLLDLPKLVCFECAALLYKYHIFKEKCIKGQICLNILIKDKKLTQESVQINRKVNNLASNLVSAGFQYNFDDDIEKIVKSSEQNTKPNEVKSQNNKNDHDFENNTHVVDTNSENDEIDVKSKEPVEVSEEMHFDDIKIANVDDVEACFLIKEEDEEKLKEIKKRITKVNKYKKKISIVENTIDKDKWLKVELNVQESFRKYNKRREKYQNCRFSCNKCFQGFNDENAMTRHLSVHSESRGKHECGVCRRRFRFRALLKSHFKEHTISYHCRRCSKICSTVYQVKTHEKYHDGHVYICKLCGDKFVRQYSYYAHLRLKHRSEFICVSCGASFVSKLGLVMHRTRFHPTSTQVAREGGSLSVVETKCDECSIIFENMEAYNSHLKNSAYHCQETGDDKIENNRILLWKSKKGRTKEQTACPQCKQIFKTKQGCLRHQATIHSTTEMQHNLAEYVCDICGAAVAKSSVRQHQNSHTKSTTYPCSVCKKEFTSPANRYRHMVTHSGEKPFSCKLCEKQFTQSSNLKSHVRTVHLKQPHPYHRNNSLRVVT